MASKRFYLDKLEADPLHGGRLRPSLLNSQAWADLGDGASAQIVTGENPVEGDDCMLVVFGRDHAALAKLPNVSILPDFALDSKVGSMHAPTKAAMRAALIARGVPGSVSDNADGFRDIVDYLGKTKFGNAGFSADSFDA